MKSIFSQTFFLSSLVLVAFSNPFAAAKKSGCSENADFYRSLPTKIGNEDQTQKLPYKLKCDTVYVRKGVTTTVYPSTMLYFQNPNLNSLIFVEGTLILQGTENSKVYISGSIDTINHGFMPGDKPWGGIEVQAGGKVEMAHTVFYGASTPITSLSRKIKITNTTFKNGLGIEVAGTPAFPLEPKGQNILAVDFTEEFKRPMDGDGAGGLASAGKDSLSEKERAELFGKGAKPFWTWKKIAGGGVLLGALAAGSYYALGGGEKGGAVTQGPGNTNVSPTNDLYGQVNPFPTNPGTQK